MKLLIFGFNKNIFQLVDLLVDSKHEVLGIIPTIEQETFVYAENRKYGSEKLKIPLIKTKDVNDSYFIEKIQRLGCDLYVNWGHTQIFSNELLESSKLGAINLHRGLLPDARGYDPVFGERVNGKTTLGQTIHFMSNKIDEGKIISQRQFNINEKLYRDKVDEIFQKESAKFYFDAINKIQNDNNFTQPNSFGKYYPKPADGDQIIDWKESSHIILSKIRSLSPYKPHFTFLTKNYQIIEILKAEESKIQNYYSTCGQILDRDESLGNLVKTGDNAIWITEVKVDEEKIIPSFPIGTTFVSNWMHEFMSLHRRIKNLEERV